MRLLVAIPVYNESRSVERVLNQVRRFHSDILLVDDASTDGTREILSRRGDVRVIRHDENQGYGRSLIDAFNYAHGCGFDWVITMDCDEQHEPETIPAFIRQIKTDRWDIISGSRYLEPRPDDDLPPGDRRTVNATITEILNSIFCLGITDAFCGFKAHRVGPTMAMNLDESGYAFPMQLWPRAAGAGLRITEIPVRLIYNDPTRHFGGKLDDVSFRMKHYLEVIQRELFRPPAAAASEPAEYAGCTCE